MPDDLLDNADIIDAIVTMKFAIFDALATSGESLRHPEKLRDAIFLSVLNQSVRWATVVVGVHLAGHNMKPEDLPHA